MHPTQTVPRLVGPGRRGASAGIQRTLLPCSARKQSPGWEVVLPPCLVGPGWCGAGAGAERRYNVLCSPCTLRKQSPCWFGLVRRGRGASAGIQRTLLPCSARKQSPGWEVVIRLAGAVRGQCWDTADIAPLLRTQTVPRLGSGFAAWLVYPGRRGASAGIQRTLLPMHPTQTVPRLVWPCSARARGWGGDTTDIAPLPPTQTVHRLIWPCSARARGWGGNATYFAPLLPTQTVSRLGGGFAAMSGWAGVVRRGRGASAGIQRTLLPCSARKQSPG